MNIWIVKDGEPIHTDDQDVRLMRCGMLASMLSNRGHNVTWITSSWQHQQKIFRTNDQTKLRINDRLSIDILKARHYKKNISIARIKHYRKLAKAFLRYSDKNKHPDIILAAFPSIELAHAVVKFANQYNIPIIIDVRDMWPDIYLEVFPRLLRPFARLGMRHSFNNTKFIMRNCDSITSITEPFLQWSLAYANRSCCENDRVFPLAYSRKMPTEDSIADAKHYLRSLGVTPDKDKLTLVFAGLLIDSLPLNEAIQYLRNTKQPIRLIIAGIGKNYNFYKKLAADSENVLFAGWLNKPQIWVLLQMADVGFAPYINRKDYKASIPNKIIEYFSAGIPVLTTLRGVVHSMIDENHCGWHYEPGSFSDVLNRVIKEKSWKEYGKRASKLYNRHFSAELVYHKYCNHIEKMAGQ